MREQRVELRFQRRAVGQIADADGAPPDLVFVGGADAAPRRAELGRPAQGLGRLVELAVDRQYERRVLGNFKILGRDRNAQFGDGVNLAEQLKWVYHYAIADDAKLVGPHDARRQQAQLIGNAVHHERMPGIVPALEAHHHVGALRQPVHHLTFTLVAPLRAYYRYVCHENAFVRLKLGYSIVLR